MLEYHVFSTLDSSSGSQLHGSVPGEYPSCIPTVLIPQQNVFLSAILSALRHQNMRTLHPSWCNMVTRCLPYFGENLRQICLSVVHQLCINIEKIADNYKSSEVGGELCPDYAVTQLQSLTILCHYCLLDSSQMVNQTVSSNGIGSLVNNTGEIFNNLVNAFFSPLAYDMSKQNADYYQTVRRIMLSYTPKIIASVAKLWQVVVNIDEDFNGVYGSSKVVKQQLMEFLSPISIHHSANFLTAIAVTWYEKRNPFMHVKSVSLNLNMIFVV